MTKLRIIVIFSLLIVGSPMAAFGQTPQPVIPFVSCNQPQYRFGSTTLAATAPVGATTVDVVAAIPVEASIVIDPGTSNEESIRGIGTTAGSGPYTLGLRAGATNTSQQTFTSGTAFVYTLKKAHNFGALVRYEITQYVVTFGYNNPNATTLTIPRGVSNHNYFAPGPLVYSQQITQFLPGIHNNGFSLTIPSQFFVISWFLDGSSVASNDATSYCGAPITYQGRLTNAGMSATAQYDFQFKLFDALTAGTELGSVDKPALQVTGGLFTAQLDFGSVVTKNSTTFLEIGVRATGDTGNYTTLNPRQQLTSTPYAIRALRAASADTLDGLPATEFVKNSDYRFNNYYLQNSTTQQPGTFNVSGNGIIGGNLTVSGTFATNGFNINSGTDSTFVGAQAGQANSTGIGNSFYGKTAGTNTSTGSFNSFFGQESGLLNSAGSNNAFFGAAAGRHTTGEGNTAAGTEAGRFNTTGSNNSFFGSRSGLSNTTEGGNTFIGAGSTGVPGISNATAIGVNALVTTSNTMVLGTAAVTVAVPGNLTVTGTLNANLPGGSGNYIQNSTAQQASSNFNVSGNGTVSGVLSADTVKATTQYNIGGNRVLGLGNTSTFVGVQAGQANSTGVGNSFFGDTAGQNTSTGSYNSFFGQESGLMNSGGNNNVFFGATAGRHTTGDNNSATGTEAGRLNTSGSRNSFFGSRAGLSNTTENNNTFIGAGSNGAVGVQNGSAIGVNAQVDTSDSLVLGSIGGINGAVQTTKVGIGTTSPNFALHVKADGQNGIKIQHSGLSTLPQIRWTDVNDVLKGAVVVDTGATPRMILHVANTDAMFIDASGNVAVTGTLSKGAGSFKIDHPLEPDKKFLYHSFVESPDMMNIYNGIVTLDKRGQAIVTMPDWFEALNQDFRYQLTSIGAPGPNLYIAKKITDNIFKIAGGKPGSEVSWQITGIRHDAYADAYRIPVEQVKPAQEQGTYLHPELFPEKARRGQESAARVRKSKQVTNR